jgi:hypothetical protein
MNHYDPRDLHPPSTHTGRILMDQAELLPEPRDLHPLYAMTTKS